MSPPALHPRLSHPPALRAWKRLWAPDQAPARFMKLTALLLPGLKPLNTGWQPLPWPRAVGKGGPGECWLSPLPRWDGDCTSKQGPRLGHQGTHSTVKSWHSWKTALCTARILFPSNSLQKGDGSCHLPALSPPTTPAHPAGRYSQPAQLRHLRAEGAVGYPSQGVVQQVPAWEAIRTSEVTALYACPGHNPVHGCGAAAAPGPCNAPQGLSAGPWSLLRGHLHCVGCSHRYMGELQTGGVARTE